MKKINALLVILASLVLFGCASDSSKNKKEELKEFEKVSSNAFKKKM